MGLSHPSGLSCQGIPGNAFPIILLIIKPPGQIGFCGTLYRNTHIFCNYDTFNTDFGKKRCQGAGTAPFLLYYAAHSSNSPKKREAAG